ncbi:bifunctional hydroxymethylpyrimidine kinase/phosphomethylpyrimidine kinase [Caloramator sp. E03]|uniref:bifunctional hydroxymethylpyrimidine kinase/phosphomethylpyrimidine kinase n=1 Tax=Caloramator sp. E03 TaxID=2576307 RepID=UPI001110698F|nr:bifunctional hydroxymethylpyrimidine kinase/phosphomethylpyrimidine kinase [Caloramator sp. E03]QCX33542.1 bifunctional hydroxymethylpyrimidine kinase/phosphomethylpyrimidine kinase [Caloramator sp. E03]
MKNVLTIAGSDSCGGAGIQADIKTFSTLGTYAMSVITAVTAQNTKGVLSVVELDTEIIKKQIDCLFEDIEIHALKIGMVSSIDIIETIANRIKYYKFKNVVLDPVMVSKSGYHLLRDESKDALIKNLFPLSLIVTPNLFEAEVITGDKIETIDQMENAARKIYNLGAKNVVVKGGHLTGDAIDVFFDGKDFIHIKGKRINTKNTHGTGCTFSSAIAAYIANSYCVYDAVKNAKEYINGAIENSIELGHGVGPVNHFYSLYKKAGITNK